MSTVEKKKKRKKSEVAGNQVGIERAVLPLSLLAHGKAILIVGGGKVAARKARTALDAGGRVTVVSPILSDDLRELVREKRVIWKQASFKEADVRGASLVFAATDDPAVNRQVVESSRKAGAMCCAVDGNWPYGDFVSPATYRRDGMVVSVTSGGRSCRRSRILRDALARHLDDLDNAEPFIMGTSHEQVPLDVLERYSLSKSAREGLGEMLRQVRGVHEFLFLQTCNRIELWAIGTGDDPTTSLIARLLNMDRLEQGQCYIKRGFDAFAHSSRVMAGIHSQTPGENHIVAQAKDALLQADQAAWAGGVIKEWVSGALHVSKEIRGATGGHLGAEQIEDTCIRFMDGERKRYAGGRVLLLGSGMLGSAIAARLVESGWSFDWCYRSVPPEIPGKDGVRVALYRFDQLSERLKNASIIICATSSDTYILRHEHAALIRRTAPVAVLDFGVPRNVDPRVITAASNVQLITVEGLKRWRRENEIDMPQVLARARAVTEQHRDIYERLAHSLKNRFTP